ncbi:hypothetical protein [Winogradskyella wichelsiae]|uniref:hypothetical protein n=1 Tax=Winogradskyella wichelsiae TaxID=2697007 RepID=UPI003EF122CA
MENNILGGLVIFVVVVTCLLLLDDISSENLEQTSYETIKTEQVRNQQDLAIINHEE